MFSEDQQQVERPQTDEPSAGTSEQKRMAFVKKSVIQPHNFVRL